MRPYDSAFGVDPSRDNGQAYDKEKLAARIRERVAELVRKQVQTGIDVVSDGEQSKSGFSNYIRDRLTGIESRPTQPGYVALMGGRRDVQSFPEFYAEMARAAGNVGGGIAGSFRMVCGGPVRYVGQALQSDIDNLRAALASSGNPEAFMPAIAPAPVEHWLTNEHYKSEEDFVFAIAEAMKEEFETIARADFVLQIDDPGLPNTYEALDLSVEAYRKWAEIRIEALNMALANVPREQVRFHTCRGSWPAPQVHDLLLRDIVDVLLRLKVGAFSMQAANPRQEHEWKIWRDVKLPDGVSLIPGVIAHTTNVVEHPELVADRLLNFAGLVGRENAIVGADCGFAQTAGLSRTHPSVMWAKFESLAEGARLASKQLWGA